MAKTAVAMMSSNNVKPFFIRRNMKLDLLLYIVFIKTMYLINDFFLSRIKSNKTNY